MRFYIPDPAGNPQVETDFPAWEPWFERSDSSRVVAHTTLHREIRVSTVFLGLDHREVESLLYETLVLGGKLDGELVRYSTRASALHGHMVMVSRVRETQ